MRRCQISLPPMGEVSPDGKDHFQVLMKTTVALDSQEPALPQARLRDVRARTLLMLATTTSSPIEHIEATYNACTDRAEDTRLSTGARPALPAGEGGRGTVCRRSVACGRWGV
jgi:hypothetical protein